MRTLLRRATYVVACWCVSAGMASAQMVDLSSSAGRRTLEGTAAGGRAAAWLAVGDLTGDYWIKELVVGSPDEGSGRGAVRVFLTRPQAAQTMLTAADVQLTGGVAGDRFGDSVDAAYVIRQEVQVVNGNPVGTIPPRDLIVGAPGAFGGRGAVYVFPGPFVRGGNRAVADAAFTIVGAAPGDNVGTLVESADLNGDRFREVIVGVPSRGVVYVVDLRGAPTTVDLAIAQTASVISGLSASMALATGDVTGDGIFDLALGDPVARATQGAVYLIRGRVGALPSSLTLPSQADAQLNGVEAGDRFGAALAIADIDVFRDFSAELLIGAPNADGPSNTRPDSGEVSVVLGRPDITAAFTPAFTLYGAAAGHHLGTQLTAGFLTRRTPLDIVMLAPGANGGSGEVFAFFGRDRSTLPRAPVDLATSASRRIISDEAAGPIESVRVWEVTGEGAEEILVGVPAAGSAGGRVYIALSPRIDLSTTTVALRAMQCVPAVRDISIENPSVIPVPWRLSEAPAWVRTLPDGGSTVLGAPGRFRLVVDTTGLAPGSYSHRLEFSSRGPDLSYTIPFDLQLTVDPPSRLAQNAHVDFTGDGCGDNAIFRPSTGTWHVRGRPDIRLGAVGDIAVAGDYDGDLTADAAVYRPSTGRWYFEGSEIQWGVPGDVPVPADYDGDGRMDIAVFRPSAGVWFVRGQSTIQWGGPSAIPVPADYDGDGRVDIAVYLRGSGTWRIRNQGTVTWGEPGDLPVPADYNGDGRADIAFYRRSSGVWSVRNQFSASWGTLSDLPMAMDTTRDGRADLVLYRRSTGRWSTFDVATGLTFTTEWGTPGDLPSHQLLAWLAGTPSDLNPDGQSEIAVWRPANGTWYFRQSTSQYSTFFSVQWGVGAMQDRPVAGDFDGDRRMDIAVWRPGTGEWHVLLSGQNFTRRLAIVWGSASSGDVPVPADYDGDRRSDIAIWRPTDGTWYVLTSSSEYTRAFSVRWGESSAGDKPVAGDYDGDGRADVAVWRPTTGAWFVLTSSSGYTSSFAHQWGVGSLGDQPLVGDFDGDGRTDLTVWRASNGVWYSRSSASEYTAGFAVQWGWTSESDVPVIGDYDGDGRIDIAFWRPRDGKWYVRTSSSGFASFFDVQWGVRSLNDVLVGRGF